MTHQNLRLGKCWKLFRATFKRLTFKDARHFVIQSEL